MSKTKKVIITLVIISGLTIIFAGLSIAAFPNWLVIPGGVLTLLGSAYTFILISGSGLSDLTNLIFGGDKKGKSAGSSSQATNSGMNSGVILAGDNNEIQNTQNIAIAFNYFGGLLGASQESMHKVANLLGEIAAEKTGTPIDITSEKFIGDFHAILKSIETESQHTETTEIMADFSNLMKPIIEKYKAHRREYNFPYADFCGDLIDALKNSKNIKNAFTATPVKTTVFSSGLGDHGKTGIHLRILSKLLPFSASYGDYYLSVNHDSYDKPDKINKIWLCALGIDAWGKMPRKADNSDEGILEMHASLERLKFSDRHITVEDLGYRTNDRHSDPNYPYHLRLDIQKFSNFIIGLASDFIIISSDTIEYDKNFNEKMKDLFSKLNFEW